MPSNDWSKPPDMMRDNEREMSLLSQAESQTRDTYSSPNHDSNKPLPESRDKIRCLDGLRGIACLLVFNYHFFWPWTNSIMLGYGAFPPRAPEPYYGLHMLPIVCLLIRGRPMVAIFFAISGYVLCRHIIRAIHERRYEAAYQKLASAAFRRAFRLYIPPTLSMLLVAVLAQVGLFKSETAIYKGPDSIYINGTVTVALAPSHGHCYNKTTLGVGVEGIAEHLHLMTPTTLNMTEPGSRDELFCLNTTSTLIGPDKTYKIVEDWEAKHPKPGNTTTTTTSVTVTPTRPTAKPVDDGKKKDPKQKPKRAAVGDAKKTDPKKDGKADPKKNAKPDPKKDPKKKKPEDRDLMWIQYGGSWEEHPLIHDNITYAAQNFTRVYAEWANPFNFGHYHPRYDPHTFTIPKELRGSFVLYLYLLSTAALTARWRLSLGSLLSVYSLVLGHWDMATFLGGAILSEMDIRRSSFPDGGLHRGYLHDRVFPASAARFQPSGRKARLLRWVTVLFALYLLSYPDAAAEYTPGFVTLSKLLPKYYIPLSGWAFFQAIGATLLLPCILHSPFLRGLLEGPLAQYMGKISFSFYLMHGPVLHCLGFWIMPRLFDRLGQAAAFAVGWVVCLAVSLYLSRWWYQRVDVWSVAVGKRVEQMALERT